jgi:hypothetical protein
MQRAFTSLRASVSENSRPGLIRDKSPPIFSKIPKPWRPMVLWFGDAGLELKTPLKFSPPKVSNDCVTYTTSFVAIEVGLDAEAFDCLEADGDRDYLFFVVKFYDVFEFLDEETTLEFIDCVVC